MSEVINVSVYYSGVAAANLPLIGRYSRVAAANCPLIDSYSIAARTNCPLIGRYNYLYLSRCSLPDGALDKLLTGLRSASVRTKYSCSRLGWEPAG